MDPIDAEIALLYGDEWSKKMVTIELLRQVGTVASPPTNTLDAVSHAIALLLNPQYGPNKKKISEAVGVKRTSMSGRRWEEFNKRLKQLKKKLRSQKPPRGTKSNGVIEAWGDEDEE